MSMTPLEALDAEKQRHEQDIRDTLDEMAIAVMGAGDACSCSFCRQLPAIREAVRHYADCGECMVCLMECSPLAAAIIAAAGDE